MRQTEQQASRPTSAWERRLGWLTPTTLGLWLVTFFVARGGLEVVEFGSTQAILLALLPIPFFAAFLWCFVSGIRGTDELERRIQLEALAFARGRYR